VIIMSSSRYLAPKSRQGQTTEYHRPSRSHSRIDRHSISTRQISNTISYLSAAVTTSIRFHSFSRTNHRLNISPADGVQSKWDVPSVVPQMQGARREEANIDPTGSEFSSFFQNLFLRSETWLFCSSSDTVTRQLVVFLRKGGFVSTPLAE
jgi:hypothetical protein